MKTISIQINTLDEAINMQNVAALNIHKYESNKVEGQEHLQSSLIRMWRDAHGQASKVIEQMRKVEEQA